MNPQIPIPAEAIATFCRKWKVQEFSLFGSVLRDDFRPDSDIDVLLVIDPHHPPKPEEWETMDEELRSIFGREIDLVEERRIKNPFRRNHILSHRRVMYAA